MNLARLPGRGDHIRVSARRSCVHGPFSGARGTPRHNRREESQCARRLAFRCDRALDLLPRAPARRPARAEHEPISRCAGPAPGAISSAISRLARASVQRPRRPSATAAASHPGHAECSVANRRALPDNLRQALERCAEGRAHETLELTLGGRVIESKTSRLCVGCRRRLRCDPLHALEPCSRL